MASWDCLCPQDSAKTWDVPRCYRCGVERPDTAALKKIEVEARMAQNALDEFDRLSDNYGRYRAMGIVLARYGRGML